MGEVSNLSEGTDRGRIDFLRGIRGGMLTPFREDFLTGLRRDSKGTWESL